MPSWQQLPGLPTQRTVQPSLVPESLASQGLAESWPRSLLAENFDQTSAAVLPMVSNVLLLVNNLSVILRVHPKIKKGLSLLPVNI